MPFFIGGAILGAGVLGAIGSSSAASTQAGAQEQAANTQLSMFNTINQQQQPFIQGGYSALNELLWGLGIPGQGSFASGGTSAPGVGAPGTGATATPGGGTTGAAPTLPPSLAAAGYTLSPDGMTVTDSLGNGYPASAFGISAQAGARPTSAASLGPAMRPGSGGASGVGALSLPGQPGGGPGGGLSFGQLTSNFTPTDFLNNLDPGYQFQLQTGGQALRNADTPGVGALSGPALKDLMSFNQGMASTGYQNAFNRFQTTNQNIFARLSGIAGLGQNAAANVGTSGTQLGTGVAQAQAAAGGSLAAGTVGATNAIGGAAVPLAYLLSGQNAGGGGDSTGVPSF